MSTEIPSLEAIRARRKQIAAEDRKLAELEMIVAKATEMWASFRDEPKPASAPPVVVTTVKSKSADSGRFAARAKTKKDLIIEALNAPRDVWQIATEIQAYMSAESGKPVPMSSVSPALTALKNSGTIVRRDMLVALALRLENEEPDFLNENGEAVASPDTGSGSQPGQTPNPAPNGT